METKIASSPFGTTLKAPFDETVTRVTDTNLRSQVEVPYGASRVVPHWSVVSQNASWYEALKQEGFGVLTTIDVQVTMKAKLNLEFERYTILGACNPQLAHRALALDHTVDALLPCNVDVHETHDGSSSGQTRIDIADPVAMLGIIDQPAMQTLAQGYVYALFPLNTSASYQYDQNVDWTQHVPYGSSSEIRSRQA